MRMRLRMQRKNIGRDYRTSIVRVSASCRTKVICLRLFALPSLHSVLPRHLQDFR
jgi:hypothetical protein